MNTLILNIHMIFATVFLLYILIDRAYIRNFIEEAKREKFYKKVKYPMLLISIVLIISGIKVLIAFFSVLLAIKALLALILIFSFFYCPLFMKTEISTTKRFMYRYFVLIMTIGVFALGLYL